MAISQKNAAVPASERRLVSLDEACARAARYAKPILDRERVPVRESGGRVLAEEIGALIPSPRFEQSAMDGYAFAASSLKGMVTELSIVASVNAGHSGAPLPPGAAARIMTGAPIPNGADTVVMQEHVRRNCSTVTIEGPVRIGSCIRRLGEDVAEGDQLLGPGQRLDAPHLALLGAQGYEAVDVLRRPRIAILSTGDEIRRPGEALDASSIYDSNKPMLLALVRQAGLEGRDAGCLKDNAHLIARRLAELAKSFDLLITTGGASVGEEDHSASALAEAGATFEVLSIALKPGKPAIVGRIGEAVYLGLPGNPVSALVSWLTLGSAVVATLMGATTPRRRTGYPMRTASSLERNSGRTEFVPARIVSTQEGPRVEILGRAGSARLRPLIDADGLAEIAEESGSVGIGDVVLFHPFRSGFAV